MSSISSMSYKTVVARYNEDIDWLKRDMSNCIIYNKGEPLHLDNEIMLNNVGREGHFFERSWYYIFN